MFEYISFPFVPLFLTLKRLLYIFDVLQGTNKISVFHVQQTAIYTNLQSVIAARNTVHYCTIQWVYIVEAVSIHSVECVECTLFSRICGIIWIFVKLPHRQISLHSSIHRGSTKYAKFTPIDRSPSKSMGLIFGLSGIVFGAVDRIRSTVPKL